MEDLQHDGLFWLSVRLAVVSFDSTYEVLDDWRFACLEREVGVDVKRAEVSEVCFDCAGLDSSCERGDPGHDGNLGRWEYRAVGVKGIIEEAKVGVAFLARSVHRASGGHDAVVEIEGDRARPLPVEVVPPIRRRLHEGLRGR